MPPSTNAARPRAAAHPARRAVPSGALATSAVVVALVLLYLPVFAHAVTVWASDQEFSFGFLLPPLAVGLGWQRWTAVRQAQRRGGATGLPVLGAGLLLLLASAHSGVHALGGASFALTVLGAVAYLYGLTTARALLFPVAVLSSGLSLYRGLLNALGFSLQTLTAQYAAVCAALAGVPVQRVGVDLFAGRFHFVVAEACSGLSSLLALLCLGTVLVGSAPAPLPRRRVLLVLIVPIVLLANVIRVTLVLTLAQLFGLAVAQGFVHGLFSAALFLAALGLFVLVGSVLRCWPRPRLGAMW